MSYKIYDAVEIWQRETSVYAVPTFSRSLDDILGGGGVKLGNITEIVGTPGSGKTQLCLQLCASVQIPKELGGLDAEALYIDTNTDFSLSRFREILSASLMRCQKLMKNPIKITEDEALKKLHHVKAIGLEHYCTLLYIVPNFIKAHPNIKLIVIDSLARPYRGGLTPTQRTGALFRHMADLQKVAVQNNIAVVLTNEMSTRLGLISGSLVAGLGDSWSHRINIRLLLSTPDKQECCRVAVIMKSNMYQSGVAKYQITEDGIRDCNCRKE